jgi:hypothetical protein
VKDTSVVACMCNRVQVLSFVLWRRMENGTPLDTSGHREKWEESQSGLVGEKIGDG